MCGHAANNWIDGGSENDRLTGDTGNDSGVTKVGAMPYEVTTTTGDWQGPALIRQLLGCSSACAMCDGLPATM